MTITLEQIRKKYPTCHYEPDPSCYKCHGSGEFITKNDGMSHACICIYIQHDYSEEIGKALGKWAGEQLKSLREESQQSDERTDESKPAE